MKPLHAGLATLACLAVVAVLTGLTMLAPCAMLIAVGLVVIAAFTCVIYAGFRGYFDD